MRQTVKVETSRPIQNTVEAFALLRALEKEFGPAQEYQFPRVSYLSGVSCLSVWILILNRIHTMLGNTPLRSR